jgi:N-acetylglutamate synthase-like GNAT family acetyltransferase
VTNKKSFSNKTIFHRGDEFFLRLVQESDIPAIRMLVNAAYKELSDMGLNYTATYQDEAITKDRISKGRAFVLEKDHEIIGTALFSAQNYFTGRKSGYVSQLAIQPALKRSGLGTVLMNFCEDLAKAEEFEADQLDTAKPALHLVNWYQKQGYKIVGETKWDGKTYESWIFEKNFSPSTAVSINAPASEATL